MWALKAGIGILAGALMLGGCATRPSDAEQALVLGEYYDRAKQRNRVIKSPPILGELISLPDAAFAERDRILQRKATAAALTVFPAGIEMRWHNAETGHGGTITPLETVRNGRRQYCRSFEETVVTDSGEVARRSQACRRPEGAWHVKPLL